MLVLNLCTVVFYHIPRVWEQPKNLRVVTYGATYCHWLWTFLGRSDLLSRLTTWNYWRSQHDRYWRDKQHAPMRSVGIAVFYCGVMHAHGQGSTDATFYMVPVAWSVFLSFYNGQYEGSRTSAYYVQIGPLGLCLSFFLGGTSTAVQGHTTYKSYMDYTILYISKFYLLLDVEVELLTGREGHCKLWRVQRAMPPSMHTKVAQKWMDLGSGMRDEGPAGDFIGF